MVRQVEGFSPDLKNLSFPYGERARKRQIELEHTGTFHVEETQIPVSARRSRSERGRENPVVYTLMFGIRINQNLVGRLRGLAGQRDIQAAVRNGEQLSLPDRH